MLHVSRATAFLTCCAGNAYISQECRRAADAVVGRTNFALRLDTKRRVAWKTACGVQLGTSVRNSTSSQFLRLGMICSANELT